MLSSVFSEQSENRFKEEVLDSCIELSPVLDSSMTLSPDEKSSEYTSLEKESEFCVSEESYDKDIFDRQDFVLNSCASASSPAVDSLRVGPDESNASSSHWNIDPVSLHDIIYDSGLPNFLGKRIPVPSTMNIGLWHELLKDYEDFEVVDFLKFGWPLGYTSQSFPESTLKNHQSAIHYSSHINEYIDKEIAYGAIIGPFSDNPFKVPLSISPLLSVPKKDTSERRTVMDLSFPEGSSVNDGIPKESYLGDPFKLHYPTTDNLIHLMNRHGAGCLLYKVDIKRCYRWIPVDPYDFHLLGLSWCNEFYFDTKIPFGVRTGAMAAQRTTNALMHIYRNKGFDGVNYIDDIGSAECPAKANEGYEALVDLVQDLGFVVAKDKCSPPSTSMVFLGKTFDSDTMSISIPQKKLDDSDTHHHTESFAQEDHHKEKARVNNWQAVVHSRLCSIGKAVYSKTA